jgi:ferredoxin
MPHFLPINPSNGMSEAPSSTTAQPDWRITLQPDAASFAAPASVTVLQAILAAGIDWPSSCRNGTCRTCMGHLLQGQVRYQIEWPGLSLEEKTEGYFLPCVACATSDLEVMLPW